MKSAPLILTLSLDIKSHKYFTALRNLYFPRHCNYLTAHLTLFHHLPSDNLLIAETVCKACNRNNFLLNVAAIKNIGNGVAFEIASSDLLQLHAEMQAIFSPYLVAQDRNKLWPHITVQNKVTAFKAKQTVALLQQEFKQFTITAVGVNSWLYLGGPWEKVADYPFVKK